MRSSTTIYYPTARNGLGQSQEPRRALSRLPVLLSQAQELGQPSPAFPTLAESQVGNEAAAHKLAPKWNADVSSGTVF